MEFIVKDHTQGCQDKAEFGTVPVLCWSGALLQVSPSCIPTGWTLRTTGQPGSSGANLKESQTARILSVMGIVWGVMRPRYGIYDSVVKDVSVLPFNCLNPSERFENKLSAGLLFFPLWFSVCLLNKHNGFTNPFSCNVYFLSIWEISGVSQWYLWHPITSLLLPELKREKSTCVHLKLCQILTQLSICKCYGMVCR